MRKRSLCRQYEKTEALGVNIDDNGRQKKRKVAHNDEAFVPKVKRI